MRLIDADKLFNSVLAILDNTEIDFWVVAKFMDLINTAPTISPPPNDPLTLDELWEMGGDPVWGHVLILGGFAMG